MDASGHWYTHYTVRLQFANPTDLNGASNWVFINSPENVQHVCLDNVRNYTRRYLPVCSKEPFLLPSHVECPKGTQSSWGCDYVLLVVLPCCSMLGYALHSEDLACMCQDNEASVPRSGGY